MRQRTQVEALLRKENSLMAKKKASKAPRKVRKPVLLYHITWKRSESARVSGTLHIWRWKLYNHRLDGRYELILKVTSATEQTGKVLQDDLGRLEAPGPVWYSKDRRYRLVPKGKGFLYGPFEIARKRRNKGWAVRCETVTDKWLEVWGMETCENKLEELLDVLDGKQWAEGGVILET